MTLDRNIEIEFKTAPLGSVQVWRVSGTILTNPKGKQIDLSKVQKSYFDDVPARGGLWVSGFKLVAAASKIGIGCSDWRAGSHRRSYFSLIFQLLEILETCNPDLTIQEGNRVMNILWGCLYIAGVGLGLFFLFAAVRILIDGGIGPGIVFGLVGLAIAIPNALFVRSSPPWKKPPIRTPSKMTAWLHRWVGW